MIWKPELILIVLTVGIAFWHSRLIKAGRPILHGVWAFIAGVLIAGATWWVTHYLTHLQVILFAIAQGCARLVVFNIFLNWFRGLPWTYTSPTTTSVIDQLERRLFGGRVWMVEAALAVVFLTIQLFL